MTKRYRQFEPVLISDFEISKWHHPRHNHNHYELIYIVHGYGRHVINSNNIDYNTGDVFLLGPEEEHYFEILDTTRFVYVKFTDLYIHREPGMLSAGVRHLEYLIKSRETHLTGFRLSDSDKGTAAAIIQVILSLKEDILSNEALIWMQVLTLAHLLQRNMPEIKAVALRSKDIQAFFCYIHKHIYSPKQLRAEAMAANFHLTKDYIGPYFRRKTGESIRSYLSKYRASLIRQRLDSGNYSLKQIAAEFGLTDESHVIKAIST